MKHNCTQENCNYLKYLDNDVLDLLKKHKAVMWKSGCADVDFGIEMSPKILAKFLKSYERLLTNKKPSK